MLWEEVVVKDHKITRETSRVRRYFAPTPAFLFRGEQELCSDCGCLLTAFTADPCMRGTPESRAIVTMLSIIVTGFFWASYFFLIESRSYREKLDTFLYLIL
jgi:hypothetical protein